MINTWTIKLNNKFLTLAPPQFDKYGRSDMAYVRELLTEMNLYPAGFTVHLKQWNEMSEWKGA